MYISIKNTVCYFLNLLYLWNSDAYRGARPYHPPPPDELRGVLGPLALPPAFNNPFLVWMVWLLKDKRLFPKKIVLGSRGGEICPPGKSQKIIIGISNKTLKNLHWISHTEHYSTYHIKSAYFLTLFLTLMSFSCLISLKVRFPWSQFCKKWSKLTLRIWSWNKK